MVKSKKRVLISVLTIGLSASLMACNPLTSGSKVVKLDQQKESIDESLLVESLSNLNNFQGVEWTNDGKVIGIKNQPINDEDLRAEISIYNPASKSFEDLVEGEKGERIYLGEKSEDKNQMIYLSLVGGDLERAIYDIYLLDLENKTSDKLLSDTTAISYFKNNFMYVARGMKLYRYEFGKEIEEINLPVELVEELTNLEDFTFEEYLNMYYKGEKVEGKRRDVIRSKYEDSKENNAIKMLTNYGKELSLYSSNSKRFLLNTEDGTYTSTDDAEATYSNKEDKSIAKSMNALKIEKEFLEDDRRVLWKLDEDGNRDIIIDELPIYSKLEVSPDGNKLVYSFEKDDGIHSSYVYNLKTDERIKIYPEIIGDIYWKDNSEEFFITGRKILESNKKENVTSVIKLN